MGAFHLWPVSFLLRIKGSKGLGGKILDFVLRNIDHKVILF
jgi:hypothetical protein